MKISYLVTLITIFSTTVWGAESYRTLSIPAKELLTTARKIQPQTGPGYSVEGLLDCSQISQEVPPYTVNSRCFITVSGSRKSVSNPEAIIQKIKQVKPMTGSTYSFSAGFVASSISQEVPPYDVSENAEVKIGLMIPSEEILKAARKIKSQTGPGYFVTGVLECSQISQEVPPYSVETECQINIDGSTELITNAEIIVESLKKVKPMTGPAYSHKVDFSASSISQEVPPYKVTESAEISLVK